MAGKLTRRGRHRRSRSLAGVLALALVSGMTALAAPLLSTSTSYAAAGDAFDPADPTVFVAQEVPTRLYKAITGASGSVTFQPEGPDAGFTYNAISYNTADNYLYGVAGGGGDPAIPLGSIIRIGQGGVVTRVGNEATVGSANWGRSAPTAASTWAPVPPTWPTGWIPPPAR
ncbi:DUF6923 family protein [Streptomyces sp. PTD5-9]|uniref:DUF6923 family protein n=1 Tax=Streptomyces sp. PTD5-9 TaxID=3120150 RepID=UPI00300809B3